MIRTPFVEKTFIYLLCLLVGFFSVKIAYVSLCLAVCFFIFFYRNVNTLAQSLLYTATLIYYTSAVYFQITDNTVFWGVANIKDSSYFVAFVCCVFFIYGFDVVTNSDTKEYEYNLPFESYLKAPYLLLAISLVSALFLFVNPEMNFSTRTEQSLIDNRAYIMFFSSLIPKTIIGLSFSCVVYYFINFKNFKNFNILAAQSLLTLFCLNPVHTPRQLILIAILPAAFFIFKDRVRYLLPMMLFFLVVLAGPLLNHYSRDSFNNEVTESFPYSPDFDAIFVSAGLIEVEKKIELGLGKYTLNSFSFFLPKELKPFSESDPLQSDAALIFSQSNLSLPPFMVGYFDFGIFGALFIGVLLGGLFMKVDMQLILNKGSYFSPLYLTTICCIVPLARGPILGWGFFFLSALVGGSLVSLVIYFSSREDLL